MWVQGRVHLYGSESISIAGRKLGLARSSGLVKGNMKNVCMADAEGSLVKRGGAGWDAFSGSVLTLLAHCPEFSS